ncbi:type I polyketide synthase [Inquilinus limosus]|uniref:Beta-ketoacyl synthase n=1 Tax=Inquilinus limosus TaxID=171674 RepID=A0A211ZGN3_9PROT|nr:type I polyketide synthase [Inquilinus limosus]OWJ64356.1 beta-ketoacyl synthase [Inquilinus limosus]
MDIQPARGVPVDPVAIIGMAFRLPGDNDTPSTFWDFITSGTVAIRDTPSDRFDIDAWHSPDPDRSGTTYSRRAGYVGDPYGFDPEFFRISQAEALEMDPQQRWMLLLCWSALEHAGIVPSTLRGQRVGLFLTAGDVDYARRTVASGDPHRITAWGKLGANRAVGVGRVAYTLGLQGPAIFLDSTCSASLTAVHLAAQSLRCGDCDLAIAGGVNLILGPEETIGFARLQAMSRTDTCRTFDAHADGYIRGEGGAVVVLKRAGEAVADRDRVEALLLGSAVNNDGASNGLTAPNGAAQEAVIRQALAQADAGPEDVAYVEAHGTGTPLGDPIELSALRNAYTSGMARRSPLLLGGLKSQIGHLEGAAGIAGLVKAILVLRHRHAPAQAGFDTPNPRFRWDGAGMEVPRTGRDLPAEGSLVAVSSFGISGTNAHAVLAPAPAAKPAAAQPDRMRVLTLSARSQAALGRLAAAYEEPLGPSGPGLRELCYTASVRREHWDHRLALVGASREEMAAALREQAAGVPSGRWHAGKAAPKSRLAFLFPGQGGWRPGVGGGLYRDNPIFRSAVDDCLSRLAPGTAAEVQRAILDRDPGRARHDPGQLAHFVVLHSLARTWIRLGVAPDIVIGHSLGEHAAAVVAGVMSLDDGLKAVEARGRLFETLRPHGAMLAVAAGAEWLETEFRFGTELFVAAINGPEQTVLSGTAAAVADAERALVERGIRVSRVPTYDTPGHSPLLAPILAPFRDALAPIRLQPPGIEMISTVTGRRAGDEIATAGYWVDMVERPVRFRAALDSIAKDGVTFLEVGPGKALSNLAKAASGDWIRAISSLCDGPGGDEDPEPDGLAHACARLYCAGHSPDWARLYGTPPCPVEAPTTAFDLKHIELPAVGLQPRGDHPQPVPRAVAPSEGTDEDALAASVAAPAAGILAEVVDIVRPILGDAADGDADAALATLGLDSLALTAIRGRLQQAFGRAVPMAWFAAGASLRSLAAFYSDGAAPAAAQVVPAQAAVTPISPAGQTDPSGHVVMLRDGPGPLVALIHPVGGDVLCYRELAAAWPGDARILGVRHPEAEAGDVRYRSHAGLARLYRRAVLDAAGGVPDIVGGWSFGGAVAQEMAAQWEEDGTPITALLAIDSPLPDGDYARRLRRLVDGAGGGEDDGLLDRMVADPGFEAVFDEQHGLGRLRAIADAATVQRVLRIHAANAAALAGHRPRPIRAPLCYALALRGGNARTSEEAAESLAMLSSGPPRVLGFDSDHFSIMRSPAVEAVAGFLGAAARRITQPVPLVAE